MPAVFCTFLLNPPANLTDKATAYGKSVRFNSPSGSSVLLLYSRVPHGLLAGKYPFGCFAIYYRTRACRTQLGCDASIHLLRSAGTTTQLQPKSRGILQLLLLYHRTSSVPGKRIVFPSTLLDPRACLPSLGAAETATYFDHFSPTAALSRKSCARFGLHRPHRNGPVIQERRYLYGAGCCASLARIAQCARSADLLQYTWSQISEIPWNSSNGGAAKDPAGRTELYEALTFSYIHRCWVKASMKRWECAIHSQDL